jgi:trehalose-phosphatase
MQHLFQSWDTFSAHIKAASHVLLLSDYDGTLTPIVGRPDEATLSPEVRNELQTLTKKPDFSIGIISGRSLSQVKTLVGIDGIYYAGNHGLEIEGPGLKFTNPIAKATQVELRNLFIQLSERLRSIDGIIIEDKGLSLSIHYRLVKKSEENTVYEILHQTTSKLLCEGKIKVTSGKKVWEVRPPIEWHKGKAVEVITQEIRELLKHEQISTLYLGDDTTDEDAFKVIHLPEGWGIFIGEGTQASHADYFLESTPEVSTLLSRLIELR